MNKLNDLQKVELDILQAFSQVARREKLAWFVMFGTLLGAVRQKGFIPWDDDIDVALPRADYDRLRLSSGWFEEPYFLQTPQNDPAAASHFIRLCNSYTSVLTDFPNVMTRGGNMGAYIDILPLDDVPDGFEARDMSRACHQMQRQYYASAALDECGDETPDWKQLMCYEMGGVAGLYPALTERYERFCARHTDAPYYALPVISAERGGRVYQKEWFAQSVQMDFEGLSVPAPVGWKETLLVSFPEGLLEPRDKYRVAKHTKDRVVDTGQSYEVYVERYTGMLDGIENKEVFIFGAGDSLRIWMERYGEGLKVVCAFDNGPSKWGTIAYGVPVRSPSLLPSLLGKDGRLIIASIYHKEIAKQLEGMGISDYYFFIDGLKY